VTNSDWGSSSNAAIVAERLPASNPHAASAASEVGTRFRVPRCFSVASRTRIVSKGRKSSTALVAFVGALVLFVSACGTSDPSEPLTAGSLTAPSDVSAKDTQVTAVPGSSDVPTTTDDSTSTVLPVEGDGQPTTTSAPGTSARRGGPPGGIECGPSRSSAEWLIVAVGIDCAEALRINDAYLTSPDLQGSSAHATVEAYNCSSDSLPSHAWGAYGACLAGETGFYVYPAGEVPSESATSMIFKRTVNASEIFTRAEPTSQSERHPRTYQAGDEISVVCQTSGEMIGADPHTDNGIAVWFKLDDGSWISGAFVYYTPNPRSNPGMNMNYDVEIPLC